MHFVKPELPFTIKSLCKQGRGEFFNINKANHQKRVSSPILNGETSKLYHTLFQVKNMRDAH